MNNPWTVEIQELHAFFVQWFRGELPNTDEAFARLESVLAEDFSLVTPGGEILDRAPLLASIRNDHGQREGFAIEIREPLLKAQSGSVLVATYEEWRQADGDQTARFCTVVFRTRPGTPNGLAWLHVHETWLMPEAA